MAPSRQVPTSPSDYTPAKDGERGMQEIFAPAEEPKSELARYRLLAPKCGCTCHFALSLLSVLMGSASIPPLCRSDVYW